MAFQSLEFLGFFIVIAPLCLLCARHWIAGRTTVLLLASLAFYMLGDAQGLVVLWMGIWISYCSAKAMDRVSSPKNMLMLGVGYHLLVLLAMQYAGFFTGGMLTFDWRPVGLSYFTFSQIWYLKSVYKRTTTPVSFVDLSLYGLFFPTVVMGPILSPADFFPQLKTKRFFNPTAQGFAAGLSVFSCGLAKKVLLADQLAVVVNAGYSNPTSLSFVAANFVILGYSMQLYLDFSGYCDMAIGLGRMLGITLPMNFNSPFRATSVSDFWRRWHRTLGAFFRECVYIPLGGNRHGIGRTYGNILLVFLVSGLWHGAGWTFIVWGLCHGLAQVLERTLATRVHPPKWMSWLLTFGFVVAAFVVFRAPSLGVATDLFQSALGQGTGHCTLTQLAQGMFETEVDILTALIPSLGAYWAITSLLAVYFVGLMVCFYPRNLGSQLDTLQPKWYHAVGLSVLLGWSVLSLGGGASFIYANF